MNPSSAPSGPKKPFVMAPNAKKTHGRPAKKAAKKNGKNKKNKIYG